MFPPIANNGIPVNIALCGILCCVFEKFRFMNSGELKDEYEVNSNCCVKVRDAHPHIAAVGYMNHRVVKNVSSQVLAWPDRTLHFVVRAGIYI